VKPHALTDDDRRKAAESRRRTREEAEIRKWEQLEPLALKRLGELLLRADDAVAQRAIADYFDRRPETAKIVRQDSRSLHVTATVDDIRSLSDADLEARLAALPPANTG
jgi:hypothetical protein